MFAVAALLNAFAALMAWFMLRPMRAKHIVANLGVQATRS